VLKTDTPYIKAETIRELLKEESGLVLSSPYAFRHKKTSPSPAENDAVSPENSFTLNLNQNLNAINKDIVQHVLHTCDGNQTAAAKRLGISRTTLWRYMNNK
jgi:DNA-binding NtrC family response regulator